MTGLEPKLDVFNNKFIVNEVEIPTDWKNMGNKQKPKAKPSTSGRVLDLHGRTQDEVYDLIDPFLLAESRKGAKLAKIMTGKGKGLVQKVVFEYLKQAGYSWIYDKLPNGKPNEGVLVIHL